MDGSAPQTQTSELKATGSLGPLAVGGGPVGVSREGFSLHSIEGLELCHVSTARNNAGAVAKLGEPLAPAVQFQGYLWVIEVG